MIDGIYNVEARTPLGTKGGRLVLACEGEVCNAELTIAGKTAHLAGTVADDVVTFEGSVKLPFPFGEQHYQLVGSVSGDALHGTCRTKKFNFDVTGTRIAE